jgi:hypothetical protein
MSESPPTDPMDRLFALSSDEQRVFIVEDPPRLSEPIVAPTPEDATSEAVAEIEPAGFDGDEPVVERGEGSFLANLVEGFFDLLEFLVSDVFGSVLKWLLN